MEGISSNNFCANARLGKDMLQIMWHQTITGWDPPQEESSVGVIISKMPMSAVVIMMMVM